MDSEGFEMVETTRSPSNVKYLAPFLLLFVLLPLICLASTNAQIYKESASILSSDYIIQGDTLLLRIKVSYSYSNEQWLKLVVQTSSPEQEYAKTMKVGPGTDVREVDVELKPVPSRDTWLASISLDKSNMDGANLEVLQVVNVYMDIKAAKENQNPLGLGIVVLLLGATVLIGGLYVSSRRRRKKRIDLENKKIRGHDRRRH